VTGMGVEDHQKKKYKRRRPNTACAECRKSHFKCEGVPPCQQCTKKGVQCYFPVGSAEKIKILEQSLAALQKESNFHQNQCKTTELKLGLLASWWQVNQNMFIPTLKQNGYSQNHLRKSKTFQNLILLGQELISYPQHQDVLLPQMIELERHIVEENTDREKSNQENTRSYQNRFENTEIITETEKSSVIRCMKSLAVCNYMGTMFYNAGQMELSAFYANKIDNLLLTGFGLLNELDQELLSSSIQLVARIKRNDTNVKMEQDF